MAGGGVNGVGLLGQAWIAAHGSNVYLLCSTATGGGDPIDVRMARSGDEGATWSAPVRVNDDPPGGWNWFGTMAVAPTGRIDVIWNDTRHDPTAVESRLYYAASLDGGATFTPNQPLSAPFNHYLGRPDQDKIGDYYHMVSDAAGAFIAYAATFNGEQDVYFIRLTGVGGYDADVDGSGLVDGWDLVRLALSFAPATRGSTRRRTWTAAAPSTAPTSRSWPPPSASASDGACRPPHASPSAATMGNTRGRHR
jgi:hypothetical protein